jgi:hypothetical protein
MKDTEISEGGMFGAAGLTLVGTIGHFLTEGRMDASYDWVWIATFALALMTLAGSMVNFDPKRWLK